MHFDRWLEKWLGGHLSIGPLTLYGFNAMHVALNLKTNRWGYICFHPTIWFCGKWWPWYFYVSPNATPWASTFAIGPGVSEQRQKANGELTAADRRKRYGHNFDDRILFPNLYPEVLELYPEHFPDGMPPNSMEEVA